MPVEELVDGFESFGWQSREGYLEIHAICHRLMDEGPIGDGDLDRLIAILGRSGSHLGRARVLAYFLDAIRRGLFDELACRKIGEAIEPFRAGPEDLDIHSAGGVHRALGPVIGVSRKIPEKVRRFSGRGATRGMDRGRDRPPRPAGGSRIVPCTLKRNGGAPCWYSRGSWMSGSSSATTS